MRNHILWTHEACEAVRNLDGFTITTESIVSLFTFRCSGHDTTRQELVDAINNDGRIYLTQGSFKGQNVIRFTVGQCNTTRKSVPIAADGIVDVMKGAPAGVVNHSVPT